MRPVTYLSGCLVVVVGMVLFQSSARAEALDDGQAKAKIQSVVPLKARAFRLEDVRLLEGPFKHAMDLDRRYLLALDADRLLHNFRVNAGLPSSAKPLGGWEEPNGELRGHSVGHYLSACALMYASTGDERLKQRADYMVAELAKCQAALGKSGYLSAYPETFFDRVEAQQRVWAPYYTLHKIYAGLLDVYDYCGNQQALDVCKKFADWVIARNGKLTDEQMQAMLGTEHGGMNESLANLYALTGDTVEVAMPFSLRTEGFKDNPNRFAFMSGPLVLCAQVDTREPFMVIVADEARTLLSLKPVAGKPSTFTAPGDVFRIAGDSSNTGVTLEPFYKMHGQRRYEVYWDRFTTERPAAAGTPRRLNVYPLKPELLKGKNKITVKFQAPTEGRMGSIFSVRIMKAKADN